jgi:hypothetical protein
LFLSFPTSVINVDYHTMFVLACKSDLYHVGLAGYYKYMRGPLCSRRAGSDRQIGVAVAESLCSRGDVR